MTVSRTVTDKHGHDEVPVKKLAAASAIGTIIEAYDFVLYGTVAALVFDELFFPNADPLIGTLAAFATFGVGFLARPVGGVVFGHYGDKVGRKAMLVISLLVMGIATILIGCLPGYAAIGILAPILLVTLRFVQGLALGGEWGGAVLMVTEYAPKGRRGFYGSWPQIGFAGGLLISTVIIAILTNVMSEAAFTSWGWRVPFFLSALLVVVGLWIRLKIEETPAFVQLEEKHAREKMPAVEVFREHPKPLLRAIGMRFSENLTFYMLIVFALSYGEDELGISRTTLLVAIAACAAGSFIAVPFFGKLSDRVGRRPVFLWGAVASVLLAIAFFPLLQTGSAVIIVLAFVLVMNTGHDAQYAVESSYFSEMFPTRVRYSGISISAQLGGVLAGAFAPLIATALVAADAGGLTIVTIYFAAMCAVSVVAAYLSPETYDRDFLGKERRGEGRFVRDREPVRDTERVGA
jgi:MFS transporter, MHS family, shikimate and dehydroshikimate transport protein